LKTGFYSPFKPAEKWCPDWGELSGMTIQAPPRQERAGADLNMDAIFTMKGLSGAAFLGYFLLL
jgi:hypothetical protein